MGQKRSPGGSIEGSCQRSVRARPDRLVGVFYRRHVYHGQKRGRCVGATKRGKGSKIMAIADASGLLIAANVTSATPHEVGLVQQTLASGFLERRPERLIGDRAYDSDKLDAELKEQGIEMIAPHRRNRKRPATQDGRALRRYKRRWKIERLFAWLQNFRRLLVRQERKVENFLGFVHLAAIKLYLRYL